VPLEPAELRAASIRLRRPHPDDGAWVAAACQDPETQRWLPALPVPYRREHAETWIAECVEAWGKGAAAPYVIVDVASGEGVGSIELRLLDPGLAEVGYWVSPAARGRGIATEALGLVARWAFDELGVERLQLMTHPGNVASQTVAERVGFRREGVLRRWLVTRDGRRDAVMFSLLPDELVRR
jgi:RimJ/RimL family protein N-acetyltransferase